MFALCKCSSSSHSTQSVAEALAFMNTERAGGLASPCKKASTHPTSSSMSAQRLEEDARVQQHWASHVEKTIRKTGWSKPSCRLRIQRMYTVIKAVRVLLHDAELITQSPCANNVLDVQAIAIASTLTHFNLCGHRLHSESNAGQPPPPHWRSYVNASASALSRIADDALSLVDIVEEEDVHDTSIKSISYGPSQSHDRAFALQFSGGAFSCIDQAVTNALIGVERVLNSC